MKKQWCFFLIIYLFPIIIYGQRGFYSTDIAKIVGVKMVDGGDIDNARFCQVKDGDKILKFSPYEVDEFGFKDDRTYKSFPIKIGNTISRYFLGRLVEGKVNLYYLRAKGGIRRYYLNKENSNDLIELPTIQKDFSVLLDSIVTGCPQATNNIPYIKLTKNSLTRFVKEYVDCSKTPFPRFQYGFTVGINAVKLSAVDKGGIYSIPNYNNILSISIGAFMDIPIQSGNFSFHPEIYYNRFGTSKAFDNENTRNNLVINYSSISFPLLLRYTILRNGISPYFQAGPVYSMSIKNEGTLFEYKMTGNNVFIDIIDSSVLQKNMGGFSAGSGMILKYGSKYSWFGELRYTKLYNLKQESKLLNISEITLGIGLIF